MMGGESGIRCPQCDHQFPTILCESCGSENLKDSLYCCRCGVELGEEETSSDWEDRKLCSDGTCIGVINEKGVCSVCGKPYTGDPE